MLAGGVSSLCAFVTVETTTLKTEDMLVCYITVILYGLVPYSKGANTGCNDWTISGQDVCCTKCEPGNRLVKSCGSDPKLLCKPCEANTYTTNPNNFYCRRCTQCTDPQFVLKPCNTMSDTVCGCKNGYRCGNEKCSFCITECKEGQEPTDDRSCRTCPEGTFNDKIHSMCKKWKESCPDGQVMKTTGNSFRDHTCASNNGIGENIRNPTVKPQKTIESNEIDTLPVVKKEKDLQDKWIPAGIAGGVAVLAVLCIIASVISCVKAQRQEEKPKTDTSDQELSDESRIMVVEQEACSFHHPEQEQGGSSESISTQDSETKLIV